MSLDSIPARFARAVAEGPDRVALIDHRTRLTYAELDLAAACLAEDLLEAGLAPEEVVGISLPRGAEMVASMLGIMAAGGAYLPIDAELPAARVGEMLAAAGCRTVVTADAEGWRALHPGTRAVAPPSLSPARARPADLPRLDGAPRRLAYVLFTSGSTGRPKGVMLEHSGALALAGWAARVVDPAAWTGVLATTALSFDLSVFEILVPLMLGGTVILAEGLFDPRIPHPLVTLVSGVPSAFRELLGSPLLCHDGLTTLAVAGEAFPPALAAALLGEGSGARQVLNLYGPTEASTYASWAEVTAGDLDSVPIGEPVDGTRITLGDGEVAEGDLGEIRIGGAGVARGYAGAAGPTADRFRPDPMGPPGSRIYRTGDLARRDPTRGLRYHGRADRQVKLKGFRIELGEVEAALERHPGVGSAAVVVDEREACLAAFVAPAPMPANEDGSGWRRVFDAVYQAGAPGLEARWRGWNSSFDANPIPAAELDANLDQLVGRVAALAPRRVVELGCGDGLVAERLLDFCQAYTGIDLSSAAIAAARRRLGDLTPDRLTLVEGDVAAVEALPEGGADLVVLNSVAQYFESEAYLRRVLAAATRALADGGHVVLGDLRCLPLADAFHTAVELARAGAGEEVAQVRARALRRAREEPELLLDPVYLAAIAERVPGLSPVAISPKRACGDSEVTAFRFDAVLRKGAPPPTAPPPTWVRWDQGWGPARIETALADLGDGLLALRGVANRRTLGAATAANLVLTATLPSVAGVRAAVVEIGHRGALDPGEVVALAGRLGAAVALGWGRMDALGSFDVLLSRRLDTATLEAMLAAEARRSGSPATNRPARLEGPEPADLAAELPGFLRQRLPHWMLPAEVRVLGELPLTPRGKVDREALGRRLLESPPVAAATDPAEGVRETWESILGVGRLAPGDSFFSLGGRSLSAIRMLARVRDRTGVEIGLRELFARPTLGEMVELVAARRREGEAAGLASPQDGPRFPAAPMQRGMFVTSRLHGRETGYNITVVHELDGGVDMAALARAADALPRFQPALRSAFMLHDGELWSELRPASDGLLQTVRLGTGEELDEWLRADCRRSFDLGAGPPLRLTLLLPAESRPLLAVTVAHIVADDWSMELIARDLSALYDGSPTSQVRGREETYRALTAWLGAIEPAARVRAVDHWSRQVDGLRPPSWRSSTGGGGSIEADVEELTIPAEDVARLEAASRAAQATLFDPLLLAFALLLRHLGGDEDLGVIVPYSVRLRSEFEPLVACGVSAVPIRVRPRAGIALTALMAEIREALEQGMDHCRVPLSEAIRDFDPERRARAGALACGFQLFDPEGGEPQPAGGHAALLSRPRTVEAGLARFDVEMTLGRLDGEVRGRLLVRRGIFPPEVPRRAVAWYLDLARRLPESLDLGVEEVAV